MRLFACLLPIWAFAVLTAVHGQSFDIEQFEQVFRPRIKVDLRHQPQAGFSDTTAFFGITEGNAVFTFPIRSRFDIGLKLDTAARGLDELLKNSVRIKASQLLGTGRIGARRMELGFDSVPMRSLYTGSIGVMGVKLTKKFRVLYWSANVNLSEEDESFDEAVPRFSGVIGQMHVSGLRRTFFYGLGIAFSDKLTLPVPFVGGNVPLGGDWTFQYLLPAQVAVGLDPVKRVKLLAGVGLDAFRSGMQWQATRTNFNQGAVRTFVNARYTPNRHLQLRGEVGYNFGQTLRFSEVERGPDRYPIDPGLTVGVGVNVLFGDGVMERVIGAMARSHFLHD